MNVHQVVVAASPGDAITNHAFELRSVLRQLGPSEIYARYHHPDLAHEVRGLHDYDSDARGGPEDVLVFHVSIGEPDVLRFLLGRPERLVVVYHNIAPATQFIEHDPAFAALLAAGRNELHELAGVATLAVADSEYNAAELREVGFGDVRVAPLVVDLDRLATAPPDWPTENHLRATMDGPVILYVGQLLPHKRPDLLVKAYHVLVTYLVPEARLVLVGAGRLPRYLETLQLFINELNLTRAWMTGPVTDAQLAAFYRRADVFVTCSEHEGFCAPLVEAMSFDLPVVAREFAAVPETLGGAGLLLPPDDDPVLLAEAMAAVLTDQGVHKELTAAGRRRLPAFEPVQAKATFLRHLTDVL